MAKPDIHPGAPDRQADSRRPSLSRDFTPLTWRDFVKLSVLDQLRYGYNTSLSRDVPIGDANRCRARAILNGLETSTTTRANSKTKFVVLGARNVDGFFTTSDPLVPAYQVVAGFPHTNTPDQEAKQTILSFSSTMARVLRPGENLDTLVRDGVDEIREELPFERYNRLVAAVNNMGTDMWHRRRKGGAAANEDVMQSLRRQQIVYLSQVLEAGTGLGDIYGSVANTPFLITPRITEYTIDTSLRMHTFSDNALITRLDDQSVEPVLARDGRWHPVDINVPSLARDYFTYLNRDEESVSVPAYVEASATICRILGIEPQDPTQSRQEIVVVTTSPAHKGAGALMESIARAGIREKAKEAPTTAKVESVTAEATVIAAGTTSVGEPVVVVTAPVTANSEEPVVVTVAPTQVDVPASQSVVVQAAESVEVEVAPEIEEQQAWPERYNTLITEIVKRDAELDSKNKEALKYSFRKMGDAPGRAEKERATRERISTLTEEKKELLLTYLQTAGELEGTHNPSLYTRQEGTSEDQIDISLRRVRVTNEQEVLYGEDETYDVAYTGKSHHTTVNLKKSAKTVRGAGTVDAQIMRTLEENQQSKPEATRENTVNRERLQSFNELSLFEKMKALSSDRIDGRERTAREVLTLWHALATPEAEREELGISVSAIVPYDEQDAVVVEDFETSQLEVNMVFPSGGEFRLIQTFRTMLAGNPYEGTLPSAEDLAYWDDLVYQVPLWREGPQNTYNRYLREIEYIQERLSFLRRPSVTQTDEVKDEIRHLVKRKMPLLERYLAQTEEVQGFVPDQLYTIETPDDHDEVHVKLYPLRDNNLRDILLGEDVDSALARTEEPVEVTYLNVKRQRDAFNKGYTSEQNRAAAQLYDRAVAA